MTIEEQAMARVQKARTRLILERRFYGVLVSNVEPVISRKFPTAATNGKQHFWNPEFVMSLTDDELLGVQAHESEHDARHHGTRRGSRAPVEWNVAGDYSINGDLLAEGFVLPKERLFDPKYAGWASEDIYRARELDKKQPQPEPEEKPEGDKPADDKEDDAEEDGEKGEQPSPGNEPEDDDAEGDEGGGDSQEAGDDDKPGKASGEAAGEPEGDGEGEGPGEGGDAPGEAGPDGQGTNSGSEAGQSVPNEPKGSGDPGGCGEVLDTATDANEQAEGDIEWDKVVRQAVSLAKAAGQLPGHIAREIERANNPPRDWRDELREFCEQGALKIETWNRPNRRFASQGITLPGSQRDGVNKAAFLIDTSGSCDDIALACVRDEAQQLLDDGIISEVVVVYGDTRVTRVDEYITGDEIEFDPLGGGGTDMQPLFQHVADAVSDASLIVCFTDLEFYKDCGEQPHCPVLFAVHGYPNRVQTLMANPPWGARAIDVGAH